MASAILLLGLTFAAVSAPAATFRVGGAFPGNGCTHGNLADALSAAAATPEEDTIRLSNNVTYAFQVHTLSSFAAAPLTLIGGYTDCSDPDFDFATPTGISGPITGTVAPIFQVTAGSVVALLNVDLMNLNDYAAEVVNNGELTIAASIVRQSEGGLRAQGATLSVLGTTLVNNDADGGDGGGIACIGSTLLLQDVTLDDNSAVNGGGAYLEACTAEVSGSLEVVFNTASRGGGLYLQSSTFGNPTSRGLGPLTDSVNLSNNQSTGGGGALYLDLGATYDAVNTRITMNTADSDGGGGVLLRGSSSLRLSTDPSRCAGSPCTELSHNDLLSGIFGSALRAEDSDVTLVQAVVSSNDSPTDDAYPIVLQNTTALVEGVTVYDNSGPVVFELMSGTEARFAFVSMARNFNPFGGPAIPVEVNDSVAELYSSAFEDSAGFTVLGGGSFVAADCLISDFFFDVTPTRSLLGDPGFRNPDVGDLSLLPASPAVDFCDSTVYAPVLPDAQGEARGHDAPESPNGSPGVAGGVFDLGADEMVWLFADGFESGNTSAWFSATP